MKFFVLLSENLQDGQQVNMTIRKNGDRLVASITSDTTGVKDKAISDIPPMVMSGTPQEFEEGFSEAFKPIAKTLSLMSEVKSYEASVEAARKQTEMEKKEKNKKDKDKKEFVKQFELAKKLKGEHKFKDAKSVLEKAVKLPGADAKKCSGLLTEISNESGEGSLFGGVEDLSDGKVLNEEQQSEEESVDNEEDTEE